MMDDPSVTSTLGTNAVCYQRSGSSTYGSTTTAANDDEQTSLLPMTTTTSASHHPNNNDISRSRRSSRHKNNHKKKKRFLLAVGLGVVVCLAALLGSAVLSDTDDDRYSLLDYYADDDYQADDDDDRTYTLTTNSWTSASRTVRHQLGMLIPMLASAKSKAQKEASQAQRNNLSDPHHLLGRSNANLPPSPLRNTAPPGCEATIVLVRHCEKGSIREHCDYAGYERAQYLATLFGNDDEPTSRWPAPTYVYAESPGHRRNPRKRNYREWETVLPLATKFGLEVNTDYSTLDTQAFAGVLHRQLRSGDLCGQVVVVSWKHSKLPRLASALGCGPREGCPTHYRSRDFDQAWQIKFVNRRPLHAETHHLARPKRQPWSVFGSVQPENFDPLAYSKHVGDYPTGGTPKGGRWMELDQQVPERDALLPTAVAAAKPHHHNKNE